MRLIRASMRGSMRKVIVTDSASPPVATAASMSRISIRFSAQNAASASSLSNIGTSSQVATAFMLVAGLSDLTNSFQAPQCLVGTALIKEPLLGFERTGKNHANQLAVSAVDTEDTLPVDRDSQVEKAGLRREAGGVRHES